MVALQNKMLYFVLFLFCTFHSLQECLKKWYIAANKDLEWWCILKHVEVRSYISQHKDDYFTMMDHFAWSGRQGDFRWHLILKCLNDLICSATIIIGTHKSMSYREEFEEEPDSVQACWKALGGGWGRGCVWVISLFQAGKHKSQGKGSKGKGGGGGRGG